MKPTITWIVLADGDQAKLFENHGPGKGLHALKDLMLEQEPLAAREIMADRPGRASNPSGPGSRAAVDFKTDPVELRERRFLERLAEMLERKHNEGAFDRLVIAAAPTALGELRPALTDGVRETILAEMPKDLTNIPMPKLAEHLDGVLAV
jgi:protein required for attachment to host cells